MAQERLAARKIGKGLRLIYECGLRNRAIAHSCFISHSTVAEYLAAPPGSRVELARPADLGGDTLFELLFPKTLQPGSRAIPVPIGLDADDVHRAQDDSTHQAVIRLLGLLAERDKRISLLPQTVNDELQGMHALFTAGGVVQIQAIV